ncbi:NB-ARC domain-containing disease resistance protein [Euphorbia peplus]|nr:NB-ARC domain-containing disease resistance protein [Euphorbia peplus]
MPSLYFRLKSDNRTESFFSEIPTSKPIQDSKNTQPNSPNLPDYLMSCIYYCIFYITSDIERSKLVRLLVAESLIPDENSAETAINTLINLKFLQVLYHIGYPPQYLSLSDQSTRFNTAKETDFIAGAANSPVRALIEDDGKNNVPNFSNLKIQSLFLITFERRICGSGSNSILSRAYLRSICKLQNLIVLDLNGKLECLPDDIGELINLRYLSLNCSYLDELPGTIGDLQNLQTLEINLSGRKLQLPSELLNLQQLKHLLVRRCINDGEIRVPNGFGSLKNLQTCDGVYAGDSGVCSELGKLTEIRILAVKRVSEDHANELCQAIMKMEKLVSVSLGAENSGSRSRSSLLPEFECFSPPVALEEVRLSGGLVEIPNWVFAVRELRILSLSNSNLLEDEIEKLQFLPELKHLALYNASKTKSIGKEFCETGGFPKLESLTISSRFLVEWKEIQNGTFPSLKHLCFRNCLTLRFLPEGLKNVSTLEGLSLMPSYNDLGRRLKAEENYKIKHIRNLRICDLY